MIPTIDEYFPELKGDLTMIEWAHATNNKKKLTEALQNNSIHMIEADVAYGMLLTGEGPMPILAHPPLKISDLSLADLLEQVNSIQKTAKKGLKLDFKSDEAYAKSWDVLDNKDSPMNVSCWFSW